MMQSRLTVGVEGDFREMSLLALGSDINGHVLDDESTNYLAISL